MSDTKRITKKEYREFMQYKSDLRNGKVLTAEGLEFICRAYDFHPEKIGEHLLLVLAKIQKR